MQIHNLYAKAACVLTLVCANLTALAGLHEPGQEKTVRVTIKAPDGQPLVGVCVGLLGEAPREVKRTGLNGTAELSINVVLDDGGGRIPIAIFPSVSLEYSEEQLQDMNHYEDLIKQYSFHMLYYVDVIPSADAYKKEIVAEEAMKIVGRFVRSDGRLWEGVIGSDRVGGNSLVYPLTGAFKLLGMPKDRNVTLTFQPDGQPEVVFIEVSATQTASSSLDLGNLVYEPPSDMQPVCLTVVGREQLKLTGTHPWFSNNLVTCVRTDG